jgi:hypothetical protein
LNSERYFSEAVLLPWACKHFNGSPWSFQQDSAPSHGSNMTQNWIQGHIPAFISKNEWPSRSHDLNPLDFTVWTILKSRVCRTPHDSWDSLKSKLTREWDLIPQEMLRVSCEAFPRRLEAVNKNEGGHIG